MAEIINLNAERMKRGLRPGGFCHACTESLKMLNLTMEPDEVPLMLNRLCELNDREGHPCAAGRR